MAKPQPPTPPNPQYTANAQTGTNIATGVANSTLGNVNQVGPTQSSAFTQSGGYTDPATGQFVPSFTDTTTLNPTLQNILTGTENTAASLVPTGQKLANQAGKTLTTPLDPNQTANNATIAGGPQALDPTVGQAAYNAATGYLQPTFAQQQEDLQDQLARQGIGVGGAAYGNAETNLANSQNTALTTAANNATVTGANQANNMYNLALAGQQQNLNQQQTLQTNPITNLAQLYGSTPTVA